MSAPTAHPSGTSAALPAKAGAAVGFMAFVEGTSGIFQGFVPPLLPDLGRLHHAGPGSLAWVTSTSLLTAAVCVPVLAKLGDMFGHRRLLRLSVALVVVGAVLMACAPSFGWLLVGRVFIGPLSAWLPLEIAIIRGRVTGDAGRRAIGLLVGCLTGGVAVGSLLAGWTQDLTGNVRLTLLVLVALAVLSLGATLFLIPETAERAARRIDAFGFAGLGAALLLLQFGLSNASSDGWASGRVLGPLAGAVVLLPVWAWWERRTPEPAVDLRMLGNRAMWPVQLAAMLFAVSLFGSQSPNSTFLAADPHTAGYGMHLSGEGIAWATLPGALTAVLGASLCARLASRIGLNRTIATGAVILAAGFGLLCLAPAGVVEFAVFTAVFGFGNGLMSGGLPTLVAERAPHGHTGITAGLYNTVRTLAGGIAGGVFAVVLADMVLSGTAEGVPTVGAYRLIWAVCAAAGLGAAVLVLAARRGADK